MIFKYFKIYQIIILLTLVASFSCQIYRTSILKKQSDWSMNPLYVLQSKHSEQDNKFFPILYRVPNAEQQTNTFFKLAEIDKQSCTKIQDDSLIKIKVNFKSLFGAHEVLFELSANEANYGAKANIDNHVILMNLKNKPTFDFLKTICDESMKSNNAFITDSFSFKEQIKNWISFVAPDCNFDSNLNNEWFCNIESINVELVLEELKDMQLTIIKRWTRQPYLIIRRIAITIAFLEVIKNLQDVSQLSKMCKMLSLSNLLELPVGLATSTVKRIVCDNKIDIDVKKQALQIALGKAFSEIEFLRELFERTSHMGILSIKISKNILTTKDMWVKLIPKEDVISSLITESTKIGGKLSFLTEGDFEQPKACWHPLFSDNKDIDLLYIAKHLDLIGEVNNISCIDQSLSVKINISDVKQVTKYLANIIASETEFVLTNGKSKILRLPIGSYDYIIKGYVNDLSWEEVPELDINIQGEFKWTKKRPQIRIIH